MVSDGGRAFDAMNVKRTVMYIQQEVEKLLETTFEFQPVEGTVNVNLKFPSAPEYIKVNFTIAPTPEHDMTAQEAYDKTLKMNADKNQKEFDHIMTCIKEQMALNEFHYNIRGNINIITVRRLRDAGYTFSGGYGHINCVIYWIDPNPTKEEK